MQRFSAICGFVFLLTAPAAALAHVAAPASVAAPRVALAQPGLTQRVTIIDFAFVPSSVLVSPGTTITWINEGAALHTVTTSQTPGIGFDSGVIGPNGGLFSEDLWDAGSYSYYCQIHPSMTGVIQVGFLSPMEA